MRFRVAQQPRQPWTAPLPDGTFPPSRVEINGRIRYEGEIVEDVEFRKQGRPAGTNGPDDEGELDEQSSLLRTGHIEPYTGA